MLKNHIEHIVTKVNYASSMRLVTCCATYYIGGRFQMSIAYSELKAATEMLLHVSDER